MVLAIAAAGCRTAGPPPAIDAAMADCVPADAATLAGINLVTVRASPLYARIPANGRAFLEAFGPSPYLLHAYRNGEHLMVARGTLTGWTAAPHGIALNGSPDLVRDALARHARSPLVAIAEPLAARAPLWAVLRGGTTLPLAGNLANANNLLRGVEQVTLAAQIGERVSLELAAVCPSADAAARYEGSLRALVSLAEAANKNEAVRAVRIERTDRSVRAMLSVAPEAITP